MSPSRSAKKGFDRNDLKGLDVLFAIVLHLLVVAVIAVLAWWQSSHKPEPMKRIEVRMISAKQLAAMQHKKPSPRKATTRPKSTPKPAHKPKFKAASKSKSPSFDDLFKGVESKTDVTTETDHAPNRDLATIMERQLSSQELEHYIALMAKAIGDKWKVPSEYPDAKVAVVHLRLRPGGFIVSYQIVQSTGYPELDRTLKAAIEAAAPFDFLPSKRFEPFIDNTIKVFPYPKNSAPQS